MIIKERIKAMKSSFKQIRVRILALALLLLAAGLTHPAQTFAQGDCQEVNNLMNFDYRSWGIGEHRKCGSCAWYDVPCHADWAVCQGMKAKQIVAGEPVALWIRSSRAAALAAGVSPIPKNIRDQLDHLFPASILDKVRYKTGGGFLGSLQYFREQLGGGAITLDDVIVFVAPGRETEAKLWAHELEHVRQYDQLGVDGFAQAYVDQTCILPGKLGYETETCKLEKEAKRKSEYFDGDKKNLVICCTRPATLALRDRVLNGTEKFEARESITVGPNVVLQAGGNVTLRAGRVINLSPGFRSEPEGKLSATIVPGLNQACPLPATATGAASLPKADGNK
jgi:hypothetical protein